MKNLIKSNMDNQLWSMICQMMGFDTKMYNDIRKILSIFENVKRNGTSFYNILPLLCLVRPDLKPIFDILKNIFEIKGCC